MKIAIVAYDFPPLNSGGSQRPYFFAKFLLSKNLNVTVFTLNSSNYSSILNYESDPEFSSNCSIIRTDLKRNFLNHSIFNSYYLNLVDKIGSRWRKQLENAILKEHANSPYNYLFFTCPPFSLALLGVHISKKIDVPLILDMRDAWSQWVTTPFASYFHYRGILHLERKALLHAKYVTYVSEQQKKDFLKIHRNISTQKFIYMPNGFEQYHDSNKLNNDVIKIFYAGSFYYNPESERLVNTPWYKKKPYQYLQYVPRVEEWKYRSPYFFFRILKKLIEEEPEKGNKVTVRFAGNKPEWFDGMVSEFGLNNQVMHLGFLNKHQMNEEMRSSNCFFVTSAKVRKGRDICVAGKTYEYFSYKKPIIGVVCEGEQKDILKKSGISVVLDPDDIDASVTKLKNFLTNMILRPDLDFIDQFRVPNNYDKVMSVLESTTIEK